jgi:phage terminase Nu1 subunit (DNA packaging protein)
MRCNRKQLADLIGRDVKTIDKMVEQGMPYVSRPQEGAGRAWVFETQAVIKWACGDVEDDTLKNAKLRLLQAKAEIKWTMLGESSVTWFASTTSRRKLWSTSRS